MSVLAIFLAGMVTMGFLLAGFFFFNFWRRTRDALFGAFGIAFMLMAANQMLVALSGVPREEQSWFYLLRFAGFAILIVAIAAKNLGTRRPH